MAWSDNFRALGRGIKLAAAVVRTRLERPKHHDPDPPAAGPAEVQSVEAFGDNPGELRMLTFAPTAVAGRPLVVLLHGCGQNAIRFAEDSGWMAAAERMRFALVMPEQSGSNNAQRCFQWFNPGDTARGMGEAGSIAAMTRTAITRFGSDPRQVFIVGLSAGAAMAACMLAAYPDMFAAGASVAGLPAGSAQTGLQAIRAMASPDLRRSSEIWAAAVRSAAPSRFAGAWPRLSIWHGLTDNTVAAANSDLLALQWSGVRGSASPGWSERTINGAVHRVSGDNTVELWLLPDFPHAYPVTGRSGPPVRFVAPAAVDATRSIIAFFGID